MKALVLAAGRSTRIASIADGLPKPLLQIAGESILSRNLRWLSAQGVKEVWINLHFEPETIRQAIGTGSQYGLMVRYVYEPEILGTAGAVANLVSEWCTTFLVVYGDNLLSFNLARFLQFHHDRTALVSIALFDRERHPHTGVAGGLVEIGPDGKVLAFQEGIAECSFSFVNAGVYLLETEVAMEIPQAQPYDFGQDVFPRLLIQHRPVYGYVIEGYCLGMDTPVSYREALRLIESGAVKLA